MLTLFLFILAMQQSGDAPEVKYNVGFIAAGASIAAALIAAVITITNSIITTRHQTKLEAFKLKMLETTQSKIETLKAELTEEGKNRDARRDYEYDAHKRLYAECEPLLFQLAELSEHAYFRIFSIARTARKGGLPRWLAGDGYYMVSTLYWLACPLVVFRLIQQRLTFVDLTLDLHIANQYRLSKLLYITFTDSFDFAAIDPSIEYRPDDADWKVKREQNEQVYWRQGLYLGILDNLIDALLVVQNKGTIRWKSFGEFERDFANRQSATRRYFSGFADILDRFHPQKRPILWRMLWAQKLIYEKIIESQTLAGQSRIALPAISPRLPAGSLDWRQSPDEASDEEVLIIPERTAREYLQTRLPDVFGKG